MVAAHPDRLRVVALAAGENADRFADQIAANTRPTRSRWPPRRRWPTCGRSWRAAAGRCRLMAESGAEGLLAVATHPDADVVLFASSGTAGLEAVLAAIAAGKRIALANKEILVMGGTLVMDAARRRGVAVLPVDSEHNAIHQCLHGRVAADVRRLVLTASGGPFRCWPAADLQRVTPDDALRHPTWTMGRKITIDSATLMNKGLEVIEARWLFDVGPDRIDVLVHPQSIVHSMVEFVDGSILAQLGVTDMRLPIQYAFAYPERWAAPLPPLDLARAGRLEFETPDTGRFPCLALAFRALAGRRRTADCAERGERNSRGGVSRRSARLYRHRGVIRRTMDAYEANGARGRPDARRRAGRGPVGPRFRLPLDPWGTIDLRNAPRERC